MKGSTKVRTHENDYYVDDKLYSWDEKRSDWVTDHDERDALAPFIPVNSFVMEPIEVEWKVLINIKYKLRYFQELEMEMYSPVFTKKVKALDGQEVMIEGYILLFDKAGELLALSANPYASCFFCGNASPASVIRLHFEDDDARFAMDEFTKLSGTLRLNYDDPDDFYYILEDAKIMGQP